MFLQIDMAFHENQTATPTKLNPAEYLQSEGFCHQFIYRQLCQNIKKKINYLELHACESRQVDRFRMIKCMIYATF